MPTYQSKKGEGISFYNFAIGNGSYSKKNVLGIKKKKKSGK